MINLEACVFDIRSILAAREGGAVRVELCASPAEGGITPSLGLIREAVSVPDIEVFIMIRPRGGDFYYNEQEFAIMCDEIRIAGEVGCQGVVFGVLLPNGQVDQERTKELVRIARRYNLGTTFHRAIDRTPDIFQALEAVIATGCDRILTSGGKPTAPEGAGVIRQLIEQAGDRIEIMPGCGITEDNIAGLVQATGLKVFHGTFQSEFPGEMEYRHPGLGSEEEEFFLLLTDSAKVRKAIRRANGEELP